MKPYLITGSMSLLKAASSEADALFGNACHANTGSGQYFGLIISADAPDNQWLTATPNPKTDDYWNHLTLPADWDKLMGILAELKKPKLPEYVRRDDGKVYKVNGASSGLNVYGKQYAMSHEFSASITEQEFIEGGLKELAEGGCVKGAKYTIEIGEPRPVNDFNRLEYMTNVKQSSSSVNEEVARVGFCFAVCSNWLATPAAKCTLIPALTTTSQGIPYLRQGQQVFYGPGSNDGVLTVGTLRHLLKQGVTELVTKAGRLTQSDLELLTK